MTKTAYIFIIIAILLGAYSCNNNEKSKAKHRPIKAIHNIRYSQYIPTDGDISGGIIVIMDPHSKPYLVMDSLHAYADEHNLALIGIKDIKNGIRNYNEIINRDLNQFIENKAIGRIRVYLLGFSGAARMAEYFASTHKIDGLIMCGAGMRRVNQLPFPTVLLAGTKDFNFLEQYYDINDKLTVNKNIISINFIGKHQWPPIETIMIGMDFIINRKKGGSSLLSDYYEQQSISYMNNKNYYFAFKSMEIAYKFSNNADTDEALSKLSAIKNNPNVKRYFDRTNLYIEEEMNRYKSLTEAMEIQDLKWWTNQLNYINHRSNKKDPISSNSYARTKSYLGLVAFSKIDHALSGKGNADLLSKYMDIYELLEPRSPYLFFFKAVNSYRVGDYERAKAEMVFAKEYDFDDKEMAYRYFSSEFINKVCI